jgi:hypothetical protein
MCTADQQRLAKAFHEAGHAVVAIEFGWTVNHLVLASRGNEWRGLTCVQPTNDASEPQEGAYFAAGSIAQLMGVPDSLTLFTDQADVNQLSALADNQVENQALIGPFATGEDKARRESFLADADSRATEICQTRWHRLRAIALHLHANQLTTGAEVAQILGGISEENHHA